MRHARHSVKVLSVSLPHILLGILKDKPLSGYDLNKLFKHVIEFFWSTEQSQIYRALYRMHDQGWVEIELVMQDDNPNKKIYHLTDTGRAELNEWLRTAHDVPFSRQAWLAQLFFSDELSPEDLIRQLEVHIVDAQRNLDILVERGSLERAVTRFEEEGFRKGYLVRPMTLDYGIRRYRFEIEWAQDMITFIREHMTDSDSTQP